MGNLPSGNEQHSKRPHVSHFSFTTSSSFGDRSMHDVDKESILKMGRLSIVNGDQSSVSYCQLLKNGTMNFYNSSNKANRNNFEGSINLKNALDIGQLTEMRNGFYIETRVRSWEFGIIKNNHENNENDEKDEKHSNYNDVQSWIIALKYASNSHTNTNSISHLYSRSYGSNYNMNYVSNYNFNDNIDNESKQSNKNSKHNSTIESTPIIDKMSKILHGKGKKIPREYYPRVRLMNSSNGTNSTGVTIGIFGANNKYSRIPFDPFSELEFGQAQINFSKIKEKMWKELDIEILSSRTTAMDINRRNKMINDKGNKMREESIKFLQRIKSYRSLQDRIECAIQFETFFKIDKDKKYFLDVLIVEFIVLFIYLSIEDN